MIGLLKVTKSRRFFNPGNRVWNFPRALECYWCHNSAVMLCHMSRFGHFFQSMAELGEIPVYYTGQGISLNGKVPFEILPEKRHIT